jgi:hypothetical protein
MLHREDAFEFEFRLNPSLIPEVDLSCPMKTAGRPLLDLLTSKFPTGTFRYTHAHRCKPWGGANSYVSGQTKISVCLFVLDQQRPDARLNCAVAGWRIGRGFLRSSPATKVDIQVVNELRAKIGTVLTSQLAAEDLTEFWR